MAAIKNDNTGWVWGSPPFSSPLSYTPIQVLTDARFVDAGEYACSFVKTDGTVWTVGSNSFGAFGNGTINSATSIIPSQMSGITSAVRTANGELTTVLQTEP
jgi:alpha-tubulin suppressor-like RCC1 family protein